jgi:hypothetical protein
MAGAYTTGKITEEQRLDVVRHACPGVGACGGMYTCVANRPIPVNYVTTICPVLQREYNERMHGDPRHVLAIFIEYSCSLSRWVLQYKPEGDLALTVSTLREIARVLPRGPVH